MGRGAAVRDLAAAPAGSWGGGAEGGGLLASYLPLPRFASATSGAYTAVQRDGAELLASPGPDPLSMARAPGEPRARARRRRRFYATGSRSRSLEVKHSPPGNDAHFPPPPPPPPPAPTLAGRGLGSLAPGAAARRSPLLPRGEEANPRPGRRGPERPRDDGRRRQRGAARGPWSRAGPRSAGAAARKGRAQPPPARPAARLCRAERGGLGGARRAGRGGACGRRGRGLAGLLPPPGSAGARDPGAPRLRPRLPAPTALGGA